MLNQKISSWQGDWRFCSPIRRMFFQDILEVDSANRKLSAAKLSFYASVYSTDLGKWIVLTDSEERLWKISCLRNRSMDEAIREIQKDFKLQNVEMREPQKRDAFQKLWNDWSKRREWDSQIKIGMYGSKFDRTIWRALMKVPCGTTLSYADLGSLAKVGRNKARAIGGSMGRNPLMLIVPLPSSNQCKRQAGRLPMGSWCKDAIAAS
jgi:O6-methylguanine-DNA--protein-cysteine methyltransferase